MLHSAIKFAYVVIALFTATMAFLIMRNFDEVAVAGPSTVVRVNESENVASGQQVTSMLESFAREHRVNIGRDVTDLQRPGSIRHLYLAVGDPEADSTAWLEDGYPGFSRSMQTEVHPIHEISDRDPRAYYLIFGPADTAGDLLHSSLAKLADTYLHVVEDDFFRTGPGDFQTRLHKDHIEIQIVVVRRRRDGIHGDSFLSRTGVCYSAWSGQEITILVCRLSATSPFGSSASGVSAG